MKQVHDLSLGGRLFNIDVIMKWLMMLHGIAKGKSSRYMNGLSFKGLRF